MAKICMRHLASWPDYHFLYALSEKPEKLQLWGRTDPRCIQEINKATTFTEFQYTSPQTYIEPVMAVHLGEINSRYVNWLSAELYFSC